MTIEKKQGTLLGKSRRDFMKKSSIIGAGAVAGTLSIARSAHADGDETIRIGLIGCGGRGAGAASQAMNTAGPTQLVAMGDVFADRLQGSLRGLASNHGDKVDVPEERQFVGFDAYQQVLACDIDLVIIATPPGFRPTHFSAAVEAGKHIFAEKPLATDAAGVRQILAANEQAKTKMLLVQIGLQRRHENGYKESVQRIQEGEIGDIVLARAYWNGGGVWTRARQENQTEMEYQMRNWYYFNWLCGDHINEQHIHNIDVINWIKNAYPVTAQGMGGREVRKGRDNGQIFDHFSVEYTYADGTKFLSQCRHIRNCWNSVSEHVHGTKGSMTLHGGGGGHQQEHHDLFRELRAGNRPNEGDYGAYSTMTAIMGRMATYSGKMVTWDDALHSEIELAPFSEYDSMDNEPPVLPDENGNYPVPIPGVTVAV